MLSEMVAVVKQLLSGILSRQGSMSEQEGSLAYIV